MAFGVAFVLILSFAVGFMTGSKLSTHESTSPSWEEVVPRGRKAMPEPPTEQRPSLPSTPIFIIPQKPQPPVVSPLTPPTRKPPEVKPEEKPREVRVEEAPREVKPEEKPREAMIEEAPREVKPEERPQQGISKMFRVMIGPMGEEEAKKLREKLKEEGKEAILIPTERGYKLQMGAFLQRENAEVLVNELKKQGYSPFLEER